MRTVLLSLLLIGCGTSSRPPAVAQTPVASPRSYSAVPRPPVDPGLCSLGEPRTLLHPESEASAPPGAGAITVAFGPERGFLLWTSADAVRAPVGTWVAVIDLEAGMRGPARRLTERRMQRAFVRPVQDGALVVGWHADDDDGAVMGWWLGADGTPSEAVSVAPGWLVQVSQPEGDRVGVVVSHGSPWDLSIHRLGRRPASAAAEGVAAEGVAAEVPAPEVLAESFRAQSRSDRRDRVVLHADSWALLDGASVLIGGTRYPLPEFDAFRHLTSTPTAVTVWDVRSSDEGWLVRSHTQPTDGSALRSTRERPMSEVELPFDPGVAAIVGPHAESGTRVQWGSADWHLPDDDSLAETWIGWTGREYAFLYASDERLVFRTVHCP